MPETLTFTIGNRTTLPPRVHEALHASVHEALKRWDSIDHTSLSQFTHDSNDVPFALELGPTDDQQVKFRVHTLNDELGGPLRHIWTVGEEFTQRPDALVSGLILGMQLHRWTFDDLLAQAEDTRPGTRLHIEFTTPTSLKSNGRAVRWPAPDVLWGSLIQRWLKYGPPLPLKLQDHDLRMLELHIRDTRIKLHLDEGPVSLPAFCGTALYEVSGGAVQTALAPLFLAERCGLGNQTAYGFGRIRVRVIPPLQTKGQRNR